MKTKFHWMLCLALLLSLLFTPTPAIAQACDPAFVTRAGHVITVKATSIDDTANLQCAFDLAVATGPGQTVRLLRGTYHTGMIFVNNFHGTFTGASLKNTVVTNLPDLYVTPVDMIYYPPSPENVWPDLISFVDSDFALSDMAFQITGDQPTLPWTIFGIDPPLTVLSGAVLIMGGQASARIEAVLVEGVPLPDSMFGYNLINGIIYTGYYGSPTLLTGSYTIKNSLFRHVNSGTPATAPNGAYIQMTRNTYEDVYYSMDYADPYNTHFEFSHNKVNAVVGLDVYTAYLPDQEDAGSSYLIKDNEFRGTNGPFIEQNFGEGVKCLIIGNNVQNVTDTGIYLGPGTKGCVVVGNGNKANIIDEGTGNIIIGVDHIRHGVGPFIHFFKRFKR
jgi:hypothetical protein